MTTQTGHIHHWMIESPNGKTSPGVCKLCGEARDFRNSYDKADFKKFTTKNSIPKSVDYLNNEKGTVVA